MKCSLNLSWLLITNCGLHLSNNALLSCSYHNKNHSILIAYWCVPEQFKICSVHPLHLNQILIRILSFLSKFTKRIVKYCLTDYLSKNNLLNSFKSAYGKSHSEETNPLSVHNCIIRAVSLQQITCHRFLHISGAFYTIDHSILEHLSSQFGFNNTVFSSFH